MNYHVFKVNNTPILFLTEYKQALIIHESEYEICKNENEKSLLIVDKYIESLDETVDECTIVPKDNIYEIYLCIANDCNAKCCYCFASQGNYGKETGLMDLKTAKNSIDFSLNVYQKKVWQ